MHYAPSSDQPDIWYSYHTFSRGGASYCPSIFCFSVKVIFAKAEILHRCLNFATLLGMDFQVSILRLPIPAHLYAASILNIGRMYCRHCHGHCFSTYIRRYYSVSPSYTSNLPILPIQTERFLIDVAVLQPLRPTVSAEAAWYVASFLVLLLCRLPLYPDTRAFALWPKDLWKLSLL